MYDKILVITIKSYYSKVPRTGITVQVPSTGNAVFLRSTVPTTCIYTYITYCNNCSKTGVLLKPKLHRPTPSYNVLHQATTKPHYGYHNRMSRIPDRYSIDSTILLL